MSSPVPLRRLLAGAAFALGTALPGLAAAQPALPPVTGNVVPQGSPIPRVLPPGPPGVAPGLAVPQAVPNALPNAGNAAVRGVSVEGATAFPASRLAGLTAGLTGPAVPLARVEAARVAILNLYRRDGYALTSVNAALGANGLLRFIVVEGHVSDVKLEGDIGPAGVQVLRFLRHLTEVRPIDTATLERWLLLAQDVPGVTLRAVLRPSAEDPGALTLVAQVERQAVNGLLTVDNRAFRQTGPVEALAVLDFNSFSQLGEKTEISLYHTEGNTQNFGQAASEFFIGGSGLRMRVYAGYGEANPSGFLRDIGYKGFTNVFGTSLVYPLIRSRAQTLNLSGFLDAVETTIKTDSGPEGQRQRAARDSLRVARIGGDYALEDLWLGGDRSAINAISVRLSKGFPGGDSGPPGRGGETRDFFKAAFDISRTQVLFQPWAGANVALRGRILGQVSGDTLPPAEKFFLGGPEFNRGFYSGEVTGDNAFAWTIELQLNTGFDAVVFGRPLSIGAQFYAFYDRGETWENNTDPNVRLSSEGIGARLNLTRFTEFNVEGVIRNTRLGQTGANGSGVVSPLKADAVFWRVLTRF